MGLHAANTCLVYKLGQKMYFDPRGAFVAALVWGVHPLHTEAVSYISGTADPLMAFFCLSALMVLLPELRSLRIKAAFLLLILGLASKEAMVMFPALLTLCLFYTSHRPFSYKTYLPTWSFWLFAGLFFLWRIDAPGLDGPTSYAHFYRTFGPPPLKLYTEEPLVRVYTFLSTLFEYAKLIVRPEHLHMERTFSVETSLTSTNVLAGLTLAVFALSTVIYGIAERHFRSLGWGFLWFGLAHAPESGLLAPLNALFLEHWMYLPMVGLFLGLGQMGVEVTEKYKAFLGALGLAALGFAFSMSVKTFHQNEVWRDPVSLYSNIFDSGESSPRARDNLGLYYLNRGDHERAIKTFNEAIATGDVYAEPRYNLAIAYLKRSQDKQSVQKAIENLKRAVEIQSDFLPAHEMLAEIYRYQGLKEKESFHKERAEEIRRRAE